jgi:alanine or glycine:cation symporter, AGCS family
MQLGSVIDFSDAMIFAMAFPNIVGIYFLLPVVKRNWTSTGRTTRPAGCRKFGKAANRG